MVIDIRHLKEINNPLIESYLSHGIRNNELVENRQQIVLPYADVQSLEWYFDGIRIGYSDWTYSSPVKLKWSFEINADLITLFINLKGEVRFINESDNGFYLGSSQHNLFYASPGQKDEGLLVQEDARNTMFMVQFPKDMFVQLIQDSSLPLMRFREQIWNGNSAALSFENRWLDLRMRNVINSILHCKYEGGIKKIFFLSKVLELLVLQADLFEPEETPKNNFIKTAYDRERIQFAMEYLHGHLTNPPGLQELSRIAGLNEYKLKRGFKEVFGNTVFGYIAEARLQLAMEDLRETNKTISQVSADLGYSSVNHFSTAFKKKFGMAPSRVTGRFPF